MYKASVLALSLMIVTQTLGGVAFAQTSGGADGATKPSSADGATKPTAAPNDAAVSDFLKEYATPGTKTPAAGDAPSDSTTAVGPITPLVPKPGAPLPVGQASQPAGQASQPAQTHPTHATQPAQFSQTAHPSAASAINEAPRSQKPAAVPMLKGRLEEIAGNGATLPVGLLLGLKAQKGKLDTSIIKPKADQLRGLLASFPTDFQGVWGGSINVWSTQFDKTYWDWDSAEANETSQILRRGNVGQTTFNFYQTPARTIYLEPAKVTFPPRTNTYTAQQMQAELKNSPFASMLGNNPMASQMVQAMSTGIPVFYLGDLQGRGVTGNQLNSRVVKNEIKQLKPGVLEQNIVSQEAERSAQNGQVRYSYGETVLRFTKLNPNQLYVQLASLKYRNDGHFLQKVIMYGTVNRGQNTDAGSMMGLPGLGGMGAGSFPGLPTSPGGAGGLPGLGGLGGFGDLNKILKDLSGN